MRQAQLSEGTIRKLVKLKNHWSFQNRRVTNPEIFGYGSSKSAEEIERIPAQSRRERRITSPTR